MTTALKSAAFAALLLLPLTAGAYTIDGNLSDWGVHPGPYGSSDWTPNPGVTWIEEDQDTWFLGPGSGGQKFDVEAMYAQCDADHLYLAIVTGHPWYGAAGYDPGDVAISFLDEPGENQFGLRTRWDGLSKGGLYEADPWDWGTGLYPSADPTYLKSSASYVGSTSFAYTALSPFYALGEHFVIEAKIPVSYFGTFWGGDFTLHWGATCGNDILDLKVNNSPPGVIPEPSTILLLGLGLLGMGYSYRRRRGKREAA